MVWLWVLVIAGCETVSSENLQKWKGTTKGPAKIEEALKNSSVPPKLRAEAAGAMIDMDMPDKVDEILAAVPAAERWEIIKGLVPIHAAGMKATQVDTVRAARDALFSARQYAAPEEKQQIDAVILPSIETDIRAGRTSGGRHSIEKILTAAGPAAVPILIKLLREPNTPFPAIVDLVVKVADVDGREQAATVLVKRAGAMKEIPLSMWKALGEIGGKAATAFLVGRIEQGGEKDALQATLALQQSRQPALLPMALRMAGDAKVNKGLRDEMFGLAERIGGLAARDGLIAIIRGDKVELVRYRAYEAALVAGRADAIVPALEAFPAKESYKKADLIDYLAKDIEKLTKVKGEKEAVTKALSKALVSTSALARMAAVLALETIGGPADAPLLAKLATDKGAVKGFDLADTVGKEAGRVAALLQAGKGARK